MADGHDGTLIGAREQDVKLDQGRKDGLFGAFRLLADAKLNFSVLAPGVAVLLAQKSH